MLRRIGVRPGRPFLHLAANGKDDMPTRAEGLPAGLSLETRRGVISGRTEARGSHRVALSGDGPSGPWARRLEIVVGDEICLTPPLGWNSWHAFGIDVTEDDVRRAAAWLVDSGLAAAGWTCVNIDDGWQGGRDRRGRIQPNERFRDLAVLCADLHAMGLRAGIYSSPGPMTCGGFAGSAGHELQDAESFAQWGFDYLKYDWCSAGPIGDDTPLDELTAPYARMRHALDRVDRDIVYHLCQYGFGRIWEWARARVGANAWRTTGDIRDTWASVDAIGFGQADLAPFAAPGGWNDPDMLVVGRVGGGWYEPIHETRLDPAEQQSHLILWVLLAAPLLLGCDLPALGPRVVEMLADAELLAIHQDPLGRQARRVLKEGPIEAWRKDLADGTVALGIFNRGAQPAVAGVDWDRVGCAAVMNVRDVWEGRDLGASAGWQGTLPPHGSAFLRLSTEG